MRIKGKSYDQGEVSVIDFLSLNPLFVATSSPGAAEDGAQSKGESYEDVRLAFLSSLLFQCRQYDGIEALTICTRPARRLVRHYRRGR